MFGSVVTRVVSQTAERRAAHSDGGDDGAGLRIQHHQVALGGARGQGYAERVETQTHALERYLHSKTELGV